MQTGMFTIIALAISTCLCAVAAVSFCKSNVFNDKSQNRIIVMMGLAAILWNIMPLGYSISTEPAFYNMFFYLLIAAFDMYVVALCLYIGRLVGMQGKIYNAFAGLGIALSVGDWLIFGLAPIHDFFQSEHLQSRRTNISCSIRSVVSRDTYGDSYGVVVMITDATSEEKVLEQSLMLEKNEHMTYQLVQTLSKTIEAKDKYTKGHSARVAK